MVERSKMRRSGLQALVLGFSLAVLAPLSSAVAADVAAGKDLALQWCASCHLVSNDQATASSVSLPSFYDMAKDQSWDASKLATFLANPHPQMPNMTLGNIEIANLAGYIQSLANE
ncbi:MAG: c-type cytochrome [Labrenzia sp.]